MEVILRTVSLIRFDIAITKDEKDMLETFSREMDLNLENQFGSEKVW
jgi:hypothetical protein